MPFWNDLYFHHYNDSSSHLKSPLVLLHGAAGNHLHWPHELRRIPGEEVFGLDLPAHGKSRGQARQTIAAYTEIVYQWLQGMEITAAVFAGHSMGGAIALVLAQEHPDCVAGLAFIGSGARLKVKTEIMQNAASEATYMNAVSMLIKSSFSRDAPPRLVELAFERMIEVRQSVLCADLIACDQFDALDELSAITKPSLILCGEDDKLTPPRQSILLAEKIQNSHLEIIPGGGHMLQLEKPKKVADAIKGFLLQIQR